MAELPDTARIRAVLLDIEGTTTPIDFVYGTLFPFARARIESFIRTNLARSDVRDDLEVLGKDRSGEPAQATNLPPWKDDSPETWVKSAVAYLCWLMDQDRKSTPLKSLQGKIWEAGYRSGELRGHVYSDVAPAFGRWWHQNRAPSIFSSGSVLAQKLLFGHSTAGDLTPCIEAYFDTTIGPKQEAKSYGRIAQVLRRAPDEIVFLSDVVGELDAARRAGLETLLCLRAGAGEPESAMHSVIHTFDELFP